MASTNLYEKQYLTSRRGINGDNTYVLILFKIDNTFIIKKKSNLHGVDENGLVSIKDRGKIYVGYCLLEGSLAEIEAAAARLDKEMNTDLESDCETVISTKKSNAQRLHQLSTSAQPSNSNTRIDGSSTMKVNNIQKKKDNNSTQSAVRSLALTQLDDASKNYTTPPPTNIAVRNNIMRESSPKQNAVSAYHSLCEVQNIMKNKENVRPRQKMLTFDDEDDSDDASVDDRFFEEVIDLDNSSSSSIPVTISKNNVRPSKRPLPNSLNTTAREKPSKRLCNKVFPSENGGNKEITMLLKSLLLLHQDLNKDVNESSKDIKNLMVLVEKLDAKVNALYENQKKMQRALTKRKINVSLNAANFDEEEVSAIDSPFKSTLICKNPKGEDVDLIQLYGVRTQLGRFTTLVMDNLFTVEELTSITKDDLVNDERYQTIKEAVRCRFKLNYQTMNIEWPSLHESILQKRRNEIKKKRNSINSISNVKSAEPVSQATEEEHIDERNTSDTF